LNRINPRPQGEESAMIPPSYLYAWLDPTPPRRRRRRYRRFRVGPGLLASIVAGGVSGAAAAVAVLLIGLA
jgi:hypothetical protein